MTDRTQELEAQSRSFGISPEQSVESKRTNSWTRFCRPLPTSSSAVRVTDFGITSVTGSFDSTAPIPKPANGHRTGRSTSSTPRIGEQMIERMGDVHKVRENYEAEYRIRGRSGEHRWFRARAIPIRDHTGGIVRWYGTCSDIHDSKLLEQLIRENAATLEKLGD